MHGICCSLVRASKLEIKQMTIRDPGAVSKLSDEVDANTGEHVVKQGRQICFLFSKAQLKFTNVYFESGGVIVACDPDSKAKGMKVIFDNCTFTNDCTLFMGDKNCAEVHRRITGMTSCVGWDKVNIVGTPKIKAL